MGTLVKSLFLPNHHIERPVLLLLAGSQASLLLIAWGVAPGRVLPAPLEVLTALRSLWLSHGLGRELLISLAVSLEAVALATALSLLLSYLSVVAFFRPLAVLVTKGRFLGLAGLTFVFTLLVGGGLNLRVALLTFGMTVFLTTTMRDRVAAIPRESYDHAVSLGMSDAQVVWHVVVVGTLDAAIDAVRQNAAIAWTMLTMVEGLTRAGGGIGALLLNQHKHFHLAEVAAIQLVVVAVGLGQDAAARLLKRVACPHAGLRLGEA